MPYARSNMFDRVCLALSQAVDLLKVHEDFRYRGHAATDKQLGRAVGLSRDVITNAKNRRYVLSLKAACLLAEAASPRDIDLIADAFSIEGKCTVPLPFSMVTDGSLHQENHDLTIHHGLVNIDWDLQDFHAARRAAYGIIRAGYAYLAEIDARERGVSITDDRILRGDGADGSISPPNHQLSIHPPSILTH